MNSSCFIRLALAAAVLLPTAATAQNAPDTSIPSPESIAFFEKSIRPVLVEKCYSCHGEKSRFAGLRLDSRAAMLKGSDHGSALDLAAPENSRLMTALSHTGAVKMPPSGKLPDSMIADFAAWIKMGAPWPAASTPHVKSMTERIMEARSKLWSLQPVRKPALPKVKSPVWAKSPIDRFVLARLEAGGLAPAKPADRVTLLRRATYDLIGLAPAPAEVDAFLADKSPDAFARVVDRLLASPQYGERWGRHWLDLARYSDTLGYLVGNVGDPGRIFPYAYTYRDYVVRAFNADKPYDQFVKEQLAADLLDLPDKRDLAALGFLTVGNHYLGNKQEIIDDRIDVVTRGLQGMTVGCARCHDHKYDPIPSADYYALYGVFASVHEPQELPQIGEPADHSAYEAFLQKYTPMEQKLEEMKKGKKDPEANKLRDEIRRLVLDDPGAPPRAMVVNDDPNPAEPHIFLRGNPRTPGDPVKRQYLQAVLGDTRRPFTKGSGRLELAEIIASPGNPLTARVLVNRVWQHHFGRPLVATPSDFGLRADPPTHPELLDWLAATFVENGWSLKKLHRLIMLSSVYQQSANGEPLDIKRDPENRLLGRMNRVRMEFEPLRDTLLQLAGRLDTAVGGRPAPALLDDNKRRTLYAFIDRQDLPGLLRTFDFADPGAHSPQRSLTTVPQQALFLMNNPFVIQQVRAMLARPEIAAQSEAAGRVRALFRQVFDRAPAPSEVASSLAFLRHWQSLGPAGHNAAPAWQYGYGEYDPAEKRVKSFTPLPHFTGQAWQGGKQLPDPVLGWVLLTAAGGHPGDNLHCAIRRWIAPADAAISIQGKLDHAAKEGNGVEAFIVSSRVGLLAGWTAHQSSAETKLTAVEVKRGDILDFVVSSRGDIGFDGFGWSPTIEVLHSVSGADSHWDASADFAGPAPAAEAAKPVTAWEAYAQALLLTNEFLFID